MHSRGRRSRLGKEDKVFAAFMAVMFALLAFNRLTGGALDAALLCMEGGAMIRTYRTA